MLVHEIAPILGAVVVLINQDHGGMNPTSASQRESSADSGLAFRPVTYELPSRNANGVGVDLLAVTEPEVMDHPISQARNGSHLSMTFDNERQLPHRGQSSAVTGCLRRPSIRRRSDLINSPAVINWV